MASSTTISISIPIELSILVETYLAETRMSRSELVRTALSNYLSNKDNTSNTDKVINEIYNELKEIKEIITTK